MNGLEFVRELRRRMQDAKSEAIILFKMSTDLRQSVKENDIRIKELSTRFHAIASLLEQFDPSRPLSAEDRHFGIDDAIPF